MNQEDFSPNFDFASKIILKDEFLGSGSFGMLHNVLKSNAKDVVVLRESIKVKKKEGQSEQMIWKIVSEHPYIIQMFDSFFDGGRLFYVVEYLPRGSLWSFIKVNKILHSKVATILTAQIALAIHFIHGKKIFHRDISNKKICISLDGKAKLSDFECSVMKESTQGLHGHLLYQAPEAFSGYTYDTNADWFSLGICLYEMVVGMTPVELHCMRLGIDFEQLDYFGKIVVMISSTHYIPKIFSKKLKGALTQFLSKDVKKRLGYNDDLETIKKHSFFKDIDWCKLESGDLTADLPEYDPIWWEKENILNNVTK